MNEGISIAMIKPVSRYSAHAKVRLGFTLLELLVVISIILILLSLLSPAIRSAINSARLAKCTSNLRQMGTAFNLYAVENNGRFPFHRRGLHHSWHTELLPYLNEDYSIFRCPSRRYWESNVVPGRTYEVKVLNPEAQHFMPYGYNGAMLGLDEYHPGTAGNRSGRNWTTRSDIENPSQMIVVADSRLSRGDRWAQSIWYIVRQDNEGVGDVHDGRANILFADGHVALHDDDLINNHPDYRRWWIPNDSFDPGF